MSELVKSSGTIKPPPTKKRPKKQDKPRKSDVKGGGNNRAAKRKKQTARSKEDTKRLMKLDPIYEGLTTRVETRKLTPEEYEAVFGLQMPDILLD